LKHIEDKQEQVRNWSPRLVCFNMVYHRIDGWR
jgi:hypothetical protein